MKRNYNAPSIEKVDFRFQEQIAAASGRMCTVYTLNSGSAPCTEQHYPPTAMITD